MDRKTLLDLPNDVLQLIVEALTDGVLFTPRYKDDDFDYFDGLSEYTNKCVEYYGDRTDDLDQRARGLLSWSVSNRQFRAYLAPYLFETIVLRDRPRSIKSVKCLMQTPYWNDVRTLIFATTAHSSRAKYDEIDSNIDEASKSGSSDNEDMQNDGTMLETDVAAKLNSDEVVMGATDGDQSKDDENNYKHENIVEGKDDQENNGIILTASDENNDIDAEVASTAESLREILSHLPPSILYLTIDLPEVNEDFGQSLGGDGSEVDSCGLPAYRHTLRNVFSSISMNDMRGKDNFELRLYNVPPYRSDVYSSENWKQFLGGLTSFTLGLKSYDNGTGWRMNMHSPAIEVARLLGEMFWDHLDRIRSFSLHCDSSWPLGGPDDLCQPLELPLPGSRTWTNLRHVSFKETFICPALLKCLQAHLMTIETIELTDCFSPNYCEYEDPDGFDITSYEGIRWDTFFNGLAETKSSKLREIYVTYVSRSEKDLLEGFSADREDTEHNQRKHQVREVLRKQEREAIDVVHRSGLSVRMSHKMVLAHCSVDDKYGMIFDGEEENTFKFVEGKYHEEWLKLLDVVERNAAPTKAQI